MTDKPTATATAEPVVDASHSASAPGPSTGHAASRVGGLETGQLVTLALRYATLLVLAALLLAATVTQGGAFWNLDNLRNIITQYTPIGLVAIGMTYVIITGNFDLSVGTNFLWSTLLVAGITGELPIWLAMVATVVVGAGFGLVNGLLITKFQVNSFIATIGTGSIIGGLALVYSDAKPVSIPPDVTGFNTLGAGLVLGFPWAGVLLVVMFLAFGFILHRTVYGRWLYAVGGNAEAARVVGIRVRTMTISTFVAVGAFAALAGVVSASNLGGFSSPAPTIGASTALDAFTIVVIGGTSVYGGEGALWRTASGLGIYAVLQNLFNLEGLDAADQSIAMGTLLVFALALNALGRTRGDLIMLFHVRMDVAIPESLDPAERSRLISAEKELAQKLQRQGAWVHLWRVVGRYSNVSVFDVESNDCLHELLWSLPLFPYMQVDVTPLAQHPSALNEARS